MRARYRDLESTQVNLAQCALVGDDVRHHAPLLLVVGGKVLDAGADPLGLDTVDHGCGEFARQQGILREVFEVPPAERVAFDVHRRAEQDADVLGGRLCAQGLADFPQ